MGALYPGWNCRTPTPSPIPGGEWAAPLSPTRVPAGRACVPPGRCQGPYNGAPGRDARPAHSAPNNHCSAAAGPAVSRGGRTGGQQMGLGCQISSLVGAARAGGWGGVRLLPPPSSPSQPLLPDGGWEGQGGWEVGEGTVCPPPLPPRAGPRGNRPQARTELTGVGAGSGLLIGLGNPEKAGLRPDHHRRSSQNPSGPQFPHPYNGCPLAKYIS